MLCINLLALPDNNNIKRQKKKRLRTLSIKNKKIKKWKPSTTLLTTTVVHFVLHYLIAHTIINVMKKSLRNSLLLIIIEIEEFKLPSLPFIYQIIRLTCIIYFN